MKTSVRCKKPKWPGVVDEEFGGDRVAAELFGEFLRRVGYDRGFALRLVEIAGGRGDSASWPVRCAATLMLESQVLALPVTELDELGEVLRAVAADPESGLTFPPNADVLAEGYSSADWPVFAAELRADGPSRPDPPRDRRGRDVSRLRSAISWRSPATSASSPSAATSSGRARSSGGSSSPCGPRAACPSRSRRGWSRPRPGVSWNPGRPTSAPSPRV